MTKMLLPVQMVFAVLCASTQVTLQAYLMPSADSDLHIYALPVGQGDATVIQCPSTYGGGVTIVDMGSSVRRQSCAGITYMTNSNILAFLGESQINYVYLTHADKDHYNIITYLNIPMDTLKGVFIGCDQSDYKGIISGWLQQVNNAGKLTTFGICTTGCASSVPICGGGDIRMKVMGANLDMYSPKECSNGDSLVLQLQHNNFKLLLPGDVEDYRGFKYDDDGIITSCVATGDLDQYTYLKPGVLRTLVNAWGAGLHSQFYRLAHHGSYPYANKPFFLEAIRPEYVFSSSMLPGTDGTFNHPNCELYDEMVRNTKIPIARITDPTQLQKEYSCGYQGNRYLEDNNLWGMYTTAVCDSKRMFHNYVIKIDTDGNGNDHIGPVELAPSAVSC